MKTNIMLDIETLGSKPGSVITSIGAVKFGDGVITDRFYRRIDPQSCVDVGLKMDVSTVLWWMKQSDEARAEFEGESTYINIALIEFSDFIADKAAKDEALVWGNGAAFDNALLSAAYDAINWPRPWKYSNDRCYRTVKALYPTIPLQRTGVHHNALNDAESQAMHLMEMISVPV